MKIYFVSLRKNWQALTVSCHNLVLRQKSQNIPMYLVYLNNRQSSVHQLYLYASYLLQNKKAFEFQY
ncbi:unnamed protein product [Meloidogyne enterolobii]|uniref:Uncharacterized protein n=1 Tax=Meloidogyne enterolobii TaxID=390850 RepID=A0ACB1B9V3_MELEN